MNRSAAPSIIAGVYTVNIGRPWRPTRRLRTGALRAVEVIRRRGRALRRPPPKQILPLESTSDHLSRFIVDLMLMIGAEA
jgi:hypothetical protein